MKQAENCVTIEGILSEVNIHEDVSKKTNEPYIMGEIKVKVKDMKVGDDIKTLEVPVRVFANQKTRKGTPNPAFESIKKLEDMVSLAACDGDESKADLIRFENATIAMNEFYSKVDSDRLVSYPIVRGTFSRKIKREDFNPTATFENVIVVGSIKEEIDRNGDETGRIILKGILPQYGDKVDVVDYIVANPAAIEHIKTYYQNGDTVRIVGTVNCSTTVEREIIEMGFGDPEVKLKTKSVNELLITKGSRGALDDDHSYESADITKALSERQARLEEMKTASKAKSATAPTKSSTDFGF